MITNRLTNTKRKQAIDFFCTFGEMFVVYVFGIYITSLMFLIPIYLLDTNLNFELNSKSNSLFIL